MCPYITSKGSKTATKALCVLLTITFLIPTFSCKKKELGKIAQGEKIKWEDLYQESFSVPEGTYIPFITTSISVINNSDVYIDSSYGIFHYDGESWAKTIPLPPDIGSGYECFYAESADHIWIGGVSKEDETTGLIYFFDGSSWKRQFTPPGSEHPFKGGGIWKIAGSSRDNLWAIDARSVYHFDGSQWQTIYSATTQTPGEGPSWEPSYFWLSDEGLPLVADDEGRIHFMRAGRWETLPPFPEEEECTLVRDLTGSPNTSLWVCTGAKDSALKWLQKGAVYRYSNGAWELVFRCEDWALTAIEKLENERLVVLKRIERYQEFEPLTEIDSRLYYFDGETWSDQGGVASPVRLMVAKGNVIWMADSYHKVLKCTVME